MVKRKPQSNQSSQSSQPKPRPFRAGDALEGRFASALTQGYESFRVLCQGHPNLSRVDNLLATLRIIHDEFSDCLGPIESMSDASLRPKHRLVRQALTEVIPSLRSEHDELLEDRRDREIPDDDLALAPGIRTAHAALEAVHRALFERKEALPQ